MIALHAPKGGTGTTFVAAQVAMAFAAKGRPVTAIDSTFSQSLKLHFGVLPSQSYGDLRSTDSEAPAINGVRLMSGYRHGAEQRADFIRAVADRYASDLIIVDIDSGDRNLQQQIADLVDLHICVVDPTPAALASLVHASSAMPVTATENLAIVLNRLDERFKLSRHSHTFLSDLFGPKFMGTIRRDEAVNEALASFELIEKFAPQSVVLSDVETLLVTLEARLQAPPAVAEPNGVHTNNQMKRSG